MSAEEINQMLMDNSNLLYCSFELKEKGKEPRIIIFLGTDGYEENLRNNRWSYVEKHNYKEYMDDKNHSLVNVFNGENVLSLSVVSDNRLRR